LIKSKVHYTYDQSVLKKANFIITAIPTPIDKRKKPNLSYIKSASKIIGQNLKKGATVVFESTVYPGLTEEICGPLLEKHSGLKVGKDFNLGYSPERINPGDKKHTVASIVKIISAQDKKTLGLMSQIYGLICKAGLYKTPNIKTAEAAKVIENTQRDLNIALANELSLIFSKMDLDVKEVMKAAATKWNIQYFEPGLVGGNCIPKDPHYLTYKALKLGYKPRIILAGRAINEYMPCHVADLTINEMKKAGKNVKKSNVLIMGLTFKENCTDYRDSRISSTIEKLKPKVKNIFAYDPLLSKEEIELFGVKPILKLSNKNKFDATIVSVKHNQFKGLSLKDIKGFNSQPIVLIDIRGLFKNKIKSSLLHYKSL
jgi:nucleotide sugar dehydrogenase